MSSEQLDASTKPHYHAHPDDPIALLGEIDEQSRTIDRAELASYVQAPPESSEDRARIAQLVEHLTFNQEVPGSNPGARTKINRDNNKIWGTLGRFKPPFFFGVAMGVAIRTVSV